MRLLPWSGVCRSKVAILGCEAGGGIKPCSLVGITISGLLAVADRHVSHGALSLWSRVTVAACEEAGGAKPWTLVEFTMDTGSL